MSDDELLSRVDAGASYMEILEYLRTRGPRPLTPIGLLSIFHKELGISFIKARTMFEYFDPQLRPIVDTALINERGRLLLLERRS
ncbi:hypothetical protein [Kutzneria buriramensis]|uniref:Uncharacterized protein n=1 Tax=Kutzneria buriramensis TaxID=1045776 RepID=A0A3E0HBZ1_9PSEU|nr:hypothetical protein [Kutzneria buriramensis]REH41090.1 hypothetical protein BCF44_112172 [Kutzneria buriramensis]